MTEQEKNYEAFFNAIILTMVTAILPVGEFLRLVTSADDFWVGIQLATGGFIGLWYFYHPDRPHPRTALAYAMLTLAHFAIVNGQPQLLPLWGMALGTVSLGAMLFAFAMYVASTRQPRDRTCSIKEIKQAASQ